MYATRRSRRSLGDTLDYWQVSDIIGQPAASSDGNAAAAQQLSDTLALEKKQLAAQAVAATPAASVSNMALALSGGAFLVLLAAAKS